MSNQAIVGRAASRLVAGGLVLALALASCGGSDDAETVATQAESAVGAPPEALTAADQAVIARTRDALSAHCRKVSLALAGDGPPPTEEDLARASSAVDELAALAEGKPGAEGPDGTTPRLALGDLAENLEGTNCDARLVAEIEEALGALPPD